MLVLQKCKVGKAAHGIKLESTSRPCKLRSVSYARSCSEEESIQLQPVTASALLCAVSTFPFPFSVTPSQAALPSAFASLQLEYNHALVILFAKP